jgi:hypothetical protein
MVKLALEGLFGKSEPIPDKYAFVTKSGRLIMTAEYEEANNDEWQVGVLPENPSFDFIEDGINSNEVLPFEVD